MTRSHLIGGTDAASLIGLGRLSPVALYLRLVGEVPDDFEGNEATEAGNLFEDHVAVPMVQRRFGMDLRRPMLRTMTLEEDPRIGVSFDFTIADRQNEVAEIKLTGSRAMWGEPGEKVPLHVAAQAQFQMAVARARGRAVPCVHVIAMFVPGFTMQDFVVDEDAQVGAGLVGAAKDMLRRVDAKDPPTPGSEADARALFLGRRGEVYTLTDEDAGLLEQLKLLRAARKDCEQKEQTVKDALLPKLGTATELVYKGEVMATWRPNKAFDANAFTVAHPDLVAAYTAPTVDWSTLKEAQKKLVDKFKVEPAAPKDQTRVFKLRGE